MFFARAKKIAKDDIGDGLLLLAGTLLATKDLLLREDVVPPHLDQQRAFLLCAQVVTLFQMATLFALGLQSSSVGAKVLLDVRRQRQNFANHNFSSSANFHG